jgi:hypothetical protein
MAKAVEPRHAWLLLLNDDPMINDDPMMRRVHAAVPSVARLRCLNDPTRNARNVDCVELGWAGRVGTTLKL